MTPDEVNDRIERLLGRKSQADQQYELDQLAARRRAESVLSGAQNVTVNINEPPPPAPVKEEDQTPPSPPRMPKASVVIPEGAYGNPMVIARFRAWWVYAVAEEFPGEVRQPTLDQFNKWREMDATTVNEPSPLAHTIQVADGPVGDRSGWHGPSQSPQDGGSSHRGSMFNGITRPGGA